MRKRKTKEKNGKKSLVKNIIEYTIIFIIVAVNLNLIIQSAQNPNKSPNLFGKKAYVIVSGSMIPKIEVGDIVVVNDTEDVKINDIIAFRTKTAVIVHRIIDEKEINNEVMYQTKGDNNNVADIDLVKKESVEGVYAFKIPIVGKILMFLYNNLVIVVVIIMFIILIRFFL